MKLYTSRYGNENIEKSDVVPVGITLGKPKQPLRYQVAAYLRDLAPDGHMFQIYDRTEFTPLFFRKLDSIGVNSIKRQLDQVSRRHGGKDIVLLCYEDVRKPGEWCHRLVFAEWWEARTGERIEEFPDYGSISKTKKAKKPSVLQMTLY
jgi:hypothetical protein